MPLMALETAELSPQAWCVRIRGEVDSSNLDRLKAAFDAIFARKVYHVVVNLQSAKYISSSGIGCLIGAFTTSIKNGGRFVIAAAPLQITEVLNLIGLGGVLRFAKDEAGALAQLN